MDRDTTKLLSETRYEPLNRFALATEKHFPRSFTRPTLGGDLNSYNYPQNEPKPQLGVGMSRGGGGKFRLEANTVNLGTSSDDIDEIFGWP